MPGTSRSPDEYQPPAWNLLTAHGLVLFYVGMRPDSTLRDLSQQLGLTERRIYTVIKDLSGADMVFVRKEGRRNYYTVNADAHFVHPVFAHLRVGTFLDTLRAG